MPLVLCLTKDSEYPAYKPRGLGQYQICPGEEHGFSTSPKSLLFKLEKKS